MSKRSELGNAKKTGGKDLDHPRTVNSNGKVILTVCLSMCMCKCVRASKSVRGCLPAFLSSGGMWGTLFLYINLSECPHPLGSVSVFVVSTGIPCLGLPQTFFPLCLKYDLFRKTILSILNMLSVDYAFL